MAEELPSAIIATGVAKSFGTKLVLRGVDIEVPVGQSLAVIGANGTGKSTLLKCFVRLVTPDAGRIELLNENVMALSGSRLRRLRGRVGFVWQRHNLVPRVSVLTNVLHGVQSRSSGPQSWLQALATREARQEAMRCLEAVGLADVALQRADQLSGGQSQRVALARVLMQRPEIVLADEPDASLDPQAGDDAMRLLAHLTRSQRLTLVFVSHRMEHAIEHSDRIVGLGAGRVQLDVPAGRADPAELRHFFAEGRR